MRPFLAGLAYLVLLAVPLRAQVATFDEPAVCTPGNQTGTAIPAGYLGLSWSGAVVRDGTALTGGQRAGVVSSPCMAFSMSGEADVTSATPFGFDGGWFAASASSGLALFATGLRGNVAVFQSVLFLSTAEARFLDVHWTDITRLHLASGGSEGQPQFVMDDLRFAGRAATVAPEPGPALLIAGGLPVVLALSARGRRRGGQRTWKRAATYTSA